MTADLPGPPAVGTITATGEEDGWPPRPAARCKHVHQGSAVPMCHPGRETIPSDDKPPVKNEKPASIALCCGFCVQIEAG